MGGIQNPVLNGSTPRAALHLCAGGVVVAAVLPKRMPTQFDADQRR